MAETEILQAQYRKHYDKTTKGYVRRCVKCGKIE